MLDLTDAADCVSVYVNGKHAGTRLWSPMLIDISGSVCDGVNQLELRVTNSMINFIQNEVKPSGLLGDVKVYFK